MKLFSTVIILIAVLGLLVFTNPKLDDYDLFINQRVTEEARKEDPVAGLVKSLFGGFAAYLISKQTIRKDYVFFSTYEMAVGDKQLRVVGVLNNFYILESPEPNHDN